MLYIKKYYLLFIVTETDKLCKKCLSKDVMKDYNCKTCKNVICDICFSKILFKNV